jgi:hypothetical protein
MATKHYENGIVGTDEDGDLDIESDIFATGAVYYVDSVTGNDANAGTNRSLPKATLASAISAATANNGDVIIMESTHAETLTGAIGISKAGLSIYGLGTGTNKPTFTVNAAIIGMDISGARVLVSNVRFPAGTTITNTARVHLRAQSIRIQDCDFTCGQYDDDTIQIVNAGDDSVVKNCSFTLTADGPDTGINIQDATALGIRIIDCSFDGGSYDWDDGAIYSAVAHTEYYYSGNTLTNKASIIHTAAAKGICTGTIAGDGSRVEV